MKINKQFRKLENIEEISVYDIDNDKIYVPSPQEFPVDDVPFPQLISNFHRDVDIFIPYADKKDFLIKRVGDFILEKLDIGLDDVRGRLLSKIFPAFYEIFSESLYEVYKTGQSKELRIFYYGKDRLSRMAICEVIYEMGRIFLIVDHINSNDGIIGEFNVENHAEDKVNMIEYFSQTGSYRKVGGKYSWTQGIYNIINRPREEHDDYYNIVFDLAIPEDKELIEKILNIMDTDKTHHEDLIRIKTNDGILKFLEINLYSTFDDDGNLISRHGLINDVTKYSEESTVRPVDFLLNGFKHSEKLALLIEPLNSKHFEFSEGFYNLVEKDPHDYIHSPEIIHNIAENEIKDRILKLDNGELDKIDETLTYNVNGDENNQRICELYIERFEFGNSTHSIGFLSDITEERIKQRELREANAHQSILIKEVHHRVKNNLQVLNSFLNLEKRIYKDSPEVIIDHMQARLTSLALLHEKTYNTRDFKNINLKDFIKDQDSQLKSLTSLKDNIQFESEVDETLHLTIEVITPLLLIMDELSMNSIKHAFPDKTVPNKKISKTVTRLDDNTAQLIFKDNGVGIENPKAISKNLGCQIIKNLTKQLDGKIEMIEHKNGTAYRLVFPINMKHTIHG